MKNKFIIVLCLSGAVIFSPQIFAGSQTPSPQEALDIPAIERDARAFFHRQRIEAFRASKNLLNVNTTIPIQIQERIKLKAVSAIVKSTDSQSGIPWFNFWWKVCERKMAQVYDPMTAPY